MGRRVGARTSGPPGSLISTAVIIACSAMGSPEDMRPPALPRAAAQDEAVAADLVGREPVEKRHAEQILVQHAGPRDERGDAPFGDRSDREAVEHHRGRERAPVRGQDRNRIAERGAPDAERLGGRGINTTMLAPVSKMKRTSRPLARPAIEKLPSRRRAMTVSPPGVVTGSPGTTSPMIRTENS